MRDLVSAIVKSLVDDEKNVSVNEIAGENTNIFEVKAEKSDIGKIIGKQGNTAKAIRTILQAASKKQNKRYILNII
jgi:predicted RNA-binding protein YlqC (UPF0109 family)